jgi:glyoxylase-like metal-dependent hydrolase (beta-lactamase superfamily II)
MCGIMTLPLEDNFEDIIGKAQRGLGLNSAMLAAKAGISPEELEALRAGTVDEVPARLVAAALGLHAESLLAIGRRSWRPAPAAVDGLLVFNTAYDDMTVNAALVFDPAGPHAAIVDTGADAAPIIAAARERNLRPSFILITHTHPDHIAALPALRAAFPSAKVCVGHGELFKDAHAVNPGDVFSLGAVSVEIRETSGHAVCGMTYLFHGLSQPVACVGDALFAGSMGGGMVSWEQALRTNRAQLFPLPDDTIVVPGHGPLTTIGEEKAHNPFYPEFK